MAHGWPSWPRSAFSLGQPIYCSRHFSCESLLSDPLLPNPHGKFGAKKLKERDGGGVGGRKERKKEGKGEKKREEEEEKKEKALQKSKRPR